MQIQVAGRRDFASKSRGSANGYLTSTRWTVSGIKVMRPLDPYHYTYLPPLGIFRDEVPHDDLVVPRNCLLELFFDVLVGAVFLLDWQNVLQTLEGCAH